MYCPVCKEVQLVMSDRQGIEIDYCPNCRGVWLDRGELDKIIERAAPARPPAPSAPPPAYQDDRPRHQYRDYDDDDYDHRGRKKRGFLGDLFDFD
jgi:Zn-finger nucleic acid-binding protein